ncbi:hypothetical protein ACFL27_26280, partial [candidate division CSSED10-310 bacterium]
PLIEELFWIFTEGIRGLIQAMMIAGGVALKYAKLWEIQNVPPPNSELKCDHHDQGAHKDEETA